MIFALETPIVVAGADVTELQLRELGISIVRTIPSGDLSDSDFLRLAARSTGQSGLTIAKLGAGDTSRLRREIEKLRCSAEKRLALRDAIARGKR